MTTRFFEYRGVRLQRTEYFCAECGKQAVVHVPSVLEENAGTLFVCLGCGKTVFGLDDQRYALTPITHGWVPEALKWLKRCVGDFSDPHQDAGDILNEVMQQREEILRAFIAKYGCEPDKIEQIEVRTGAGIKWYVRCKSEG